jgi:hypothetical protein
MTLWSLVLIIDIMKSKETLCSLPSRHYAVSLRDTMQSQSFSGHYAVLFCMYRHYAALLDTMQSLVHRHYAVVSAVALDYPFFPFSLSCNLFYTTNNNIIQIILICILIRRPLYSEPL